VDVERIDGFSWRVPVGTVEGMRVPGVVFGTEELVRRAVDDRAVLQVANVATLPGIVGASMAMPDIHWGYGFPIGGVAAFDAEGDGVVSPGGVGFDIACGVRLIRTDLAWDEVALRIGELVAALGRETPRGTGTGGRLAVSRAELLRVLRDGVRLFSRDLRATTVREGRALSRHCDFVPQLAKIDAILGARAPVSEQ